MSKRRGPPATRGGAGRGPAWHSVNGERCWGGRLHPWGAWQASVTEPEWRWRQCRRCDERETVPATERARPRL
jgi:hypothetical protein